MHTRIHIPPAVRGLRLAKRYVNASDVAWWKSYAHRRQRRFFKRLLHEMCDDPELYYDEGFRGLPRPLTSWDLD